MSYKGHRGILGPDLHDPAVREEHNKWVLERELERQWQEAQVRADKVLDTWIMRSPLTRGLVLRADGIALCDDDCHDSPRRFKGQHPSDARAQAAQALMAEDETLRSL